MKLNICCADKLLEGYLNVDIEPPLKRLTEHPKGYTERFNQAYFIGQCHFMRVNLCGPWPWPDSSIDEINAYDAIEHLPDQIHTMNEAWRVLKPGGQFNIDVPTTDGRGAWQDPTHVSFWNRNSFWYYEKGNLHRERFKGASSVKAEVKAAFKVLDEKERVGALETFGPNFTKLWILLEAVKEEKP